MIKYLSKTNRQALAGVALLRLDFNTKDDWRMEAVLPTVKLLAKTASKVVIVSHRGRPDGGEIVNGRPKGFPADLHLHRDAVRLVEAAELSFPIHRVRRWPGRGVPRRPGRWP